MIAETEVEVEVEVGGGWLVHRLVFCACRFLQAHVLVGWNKSRLVQGSFWGPQGGGVM